MNALLLARNADERAVLTTALGLCGLSARHIQGLDEVIDHWPDQPIDLILLSLEKEIPLQNLKLLRAQTEVALVVVLDPMAESYLVDLYDSGVDLAICRPYSTRLLIAQMRALLRRSSSIPFFSLPTISRGAVVLDPSNRTVQVQNGPANRLTQLEFRLLYTLMTHEGQIMPPELLVEHVWGYSGQGDKNLVRGLVRRLRKKLEPDPKNPRYIRTLSGVGYVFQA
jgi:DNA-binding response OmpR family regulator